MKVALIGDSILDNDEYTGVAACVFTNVKQKLPEAVVVNFAEDGATTLDINDQLEKIKGQDEKWDYVFLSIGGNDLLESQELLLLSNTEQKKKIIESICIRVSDIYTMLQADFNKVILLTPYLPVFDGIDKESVLQAHQVIKAFNEKLKGIANVRYEELHPILNSKEDFINHIEPSKIGSEKIAALIEEVVRN